LSKLRHDDGREEVIIFRGSAGPDHKREKSFHILQALWRNGFHTEIFGIPQPIGYFPEFGMLLYRNIPGTSLMESFEHGKNHYQEKIKSAIDLLIEFHAKKPPAVPEAHFFWYKEKGSFEKLIETICTKYTAHCHRIKQVAALLLASEKEILDPKSFTLVHGDFQPNNIIFSEDGKASLIDFNDAYLFDELYDLAYFTTQVTFMLTRLNQTDLTPFLQEQTIYYCSKRGIEFNELIHKKMALFRAKTLLSIKALTTHEQGLLILDEIESNVRQTM